MLSLLKAGDRVGLVQRTEGSTVYLFGYGVLQESQSPDASVTMHLSTEIDQAKVQRCAKLDSGILVYESECGMIESETWIEERFRNHKMEILDIRKYRSQN